MIDRSVCFFCKSEIELDSMVPLYFTKTYCVGTCVKCKLITNVFYGEMEKCYTFTQKSEVSPSKDTVASQTDGLSGEDAMYLLMVHLSRSFHDLPPKLKRTILLEGSNHLAMKLRK